MGRKLVIFFALLVGGCVDTAPPEDNSIEVCRPGGVAPADLTIGELVVPHERLVARLQPDLYTDNYAILISFDEEGAAALAQLTRENLNAPIALSLDGEVISEPIVRSPILGGQLQITGNFTRNAASDIVARLSMPCQLEGETQ